MELSPASMRRLALVIVFFLLYFGADITQAARSPAIRPGRSSPERQRQVSDAFRNFTGDNNPRVVGRLRSLPANDSDILINATRNPQKLKELSEKSWKEIGVTILMGLIKRKQVHIIIQLWSDVKLKIVLEKYVLPKLNANVTRRLLKSVSDDDFKRLVLPLLQNIGLMPGARNATCQRVKKVFSKPDSKQSSDAGRTAGKKSVAKQAPKCPAVKQEKVREMKRFLSCFNKKCFLGLSKEQLKIVLGSFPAEKVGAWLDKNITSRLLGDCAALTEEDLKGPLGTLVKHAGDKCSQAIPPEKYCKVVGRGGGFGGSSGKNKPSKVFAEEMRKKMKKGCASNLRDPDFLSSNPDLCRSFKKSDVNNVKLPTENSKKKEFLEKCLCPKGTSKQQAKQVIRKVMKAVGKDVSKWDKPLIESIKYCICGLKLEDFKKMPNAIVKSAWNSLKSGVKQCGKSRCKIGKILVRKFMEAEGLTDKDPNAVKKVGDLFLCLGRKVFLALGKGVAKDFDVTAIANMKSKSGRKRLLFVLFTDLSLKDMGPSARSLSLKDMKSQSIEDLGLGANSTEEDAEKLKNVELSIPAAQTVIKITISSWGQPSENNTVYWTPSDITDVLKPAVKGIPKETIEKLPSNRILDVVQGLVEHDSKEIYPQCKALVKKIKEIQNLKKSSDFKTSSVKTFGKCLGELMEEELQNLPETNEVCVFFGTIQGYESAGKKKNMAIFCISFMTEGKGAKDLKSDHLSALGNLVAFLKASELAEIPAGELDGALSDVAKAFCGHVFKDESKDKREAQKWNDQIHKKRKDLVAKLKDKANNIDRLGCLFGGLEERDVEGVSKETLQDNADEIKKCKNKGLQKAANKKVREPEKKSRRKRRDLSSETAEDIESLSLQALDADDITTISCDAFNSNIEEIGNTAFSESQLKAWAQVVKKCWNKDVKLYTADQLQSLGTLARGFTADELGMMDLSEDESIETLGEESYTDEQLKKAWQQVKTKKGKAVKDLDQFELASLGNFAKAMTPEEIGQIGPFEEVVENLGNITGWSEEQLDQLKKMASKFYGSDASKWDTAEIYNVGTVVGGFSEDELKNLNDEQLKYITDDGVAEIPARKLNALSLDQLNTMKPSQLAAITSEQKDGLSVAKRNALEKETGAEEPQDDAGSNMVYSLVVLLVPFVNAFIFAN